jgi:hypothetical protein
VEPSCGLDGWTDYFKQPDDAVECVLKATHAPGWVYAVLVLVTFTLGWWEFTRKRAREVATARQAVRSWTTLAQRATVRLVVFALLFLACCYAVARLADMLWGTSGAPTSMFDGMLRSQVYPVEYQWALVSGPPHLTYVSGWTLIGAGLLTVLLVYATLAAATGIRGVVTFVLRSVLIVSSIAAVMTGVATLGSLTEDPPLSTTLPFFYGMWAVGFLLLAVVVSRLEDAGADLAYALSQHSRAPAP